MDTIKEVSALGYTVRYRACEALTPDGVTVAVQDWSADGAPRKAELLLLHGFSQAHGSWLHQVASPLAGEYRLVTYDLRGHGESGKPAEAHFYREPARWANEVRAVIEQTGLQRPILVPWSYAGRVALDYLSVFGDAGISGLILVDATTRAGPLGPAAAHLKEMTSPDAAVARQGSISLLRGCAARPLSPQELDYMLEYTEKVPVAIRQHLAGRPADYESVLRSVRVPTLVIQGMLDPVTLPATAEYTISQVPGAQLINYGDLAHMPFWESPQRFNEDVARFVRERVLPQPAGAAP